MKTLLLDPTTWDLLLDSAGNIAVASDPYSQAQDAASAIKTWRGEAYYDTTLGLPYFESILGQVPPISLMKAEINAAALSVPGVETSVCYLTSFINRKLSGQVHITNVQGDQSAVGF